jgi:capsular polysaccharide transport system permease protein
VFCLGVLVLWTFTKPAYEHGIKLAPFVMTGYMCLILIRHMIGALVNALQANLGLLYHRQISPVHIFSTRVMLEIAGTTTAFIVVYIVLLALGQVSLPRDYLLLYGGWFLIAWMSTGFALILAGLAMRYETFERVTGLIGYLLIPLSGVFAMVEWLPPNMQKIILYVPFVHGVEMARAGVFSEFVPTHYDAFYGFVWGAVFNVVGLALIAGARSRIIVD